MSLNDIEEALRQFFEQVDPSFGVPSSQQTPIEEVQGLWRKYISGLFYCGGKKRQFYALTLEGNDNSRQFALIGALESELGGFCSDLRYNYGYSSQFGQYSDGPLWPEIEIGEL